MELLILWQAFLRQWKLLLISLILGIFAGALFTLFIAKTEYRATYFLSIVNKVDTTQQDKAYDPLAYVEAADRFTEAILGWFGNPSLAQKITENHSSLMNTTIVDTIKVRKQEKQNINVRFSAPTEALAIEFKDALRDYLQGNITAINKESNTSFGIANDSYTIETQKPSLFLFTSIGGLGATSILFLLLLFWELISGKVMYQDQVERILGQAPMDSGRASTLVPFLAAYLQKIASPTVILSVTTLQTSWFSKVINTLAQHTHHPFVAVDADLKGRSLLKHYSKVEHMKNMKGISDTPPKNEAGAIPTLQVAKDNPMLHIVPAGKGETINTHVVSQLVQQNTNTFFYSSFPDTMEMALQKEVHYILVITLGKTSLRHILQLKSLQLPNYHYLIITA